MLSQPLASSICAERRPVLVGTENFQPHAWKWVWSWESAKQETALVLPQQSPSHAMSNVHCANTALPGGSLRIRGEQVKGYKGLRQSYLLSGESNLVAEPLNGRSPSRVLFFWNEGGLWVLQQGRHTAWLLRSAFRRPSCAWCPCRVPSWLGAPTTPLPGTGSAPS